MICSSVLQYTDANNYTVHLFKYPCPVTPSLLMTNFYIFILEINDYNKASNNLIQIRLFISIKQLMSIKSNKSDYI